MNKKNKKALLFFIVILLITLGVIASYYMLKDDTYIASINTIKTNTNNTTKNNTVVKTQSNTTNEANKLNNTLENTVDNVITTNVIEGNSENNTQKAIDIVKKDWGTDESVYFNDAGMDNEGRYVISVHDKDTTETLAWYSVDIRTGQFFKQ